MDRMILQDGISAIILSIIILYIFFCSGFAGLGLRNP